ncbi:MAG: DNA polymerase III subunit alpha [Bacteroidetes bacterium]|nr:DNA polymerase III subunit alpha [Bacteroidota bacterium]
MSQFIHLHCHTHYSLLDGAASVDALINAAVENNMPAVALTDHGVMFGALEFYKKAKKKKIKPIIGCEFYIVTKGSRFDRGQMVTQCDTIAPTGGKTGRNVYHHIVLLAKNEIGYKNMIKLTTLGHIEGFYYKPRIDYQLLSQYSEGIVCLSACAGGIVASHLVNNNYDEAKDVAKMYKDVFGDDFYLELQDHNYEIETNVLAGIPKISKELDIKLIATNDVHYINSKHAIGHNIMLNIPDASSTNPVDYKTLRYGTDQIYFKTADEMSKIFKNHPDAIENTLEVAEKCDLKLDFNKNFMPKFVIPSTAKEKILDEYLAKLTNVGLTKRYSTLTQEIETRAKYELSVISKMGFADYFLIVADFISAAREKGILVGPGRGSAAGSIVSFALGITNIDPLKYGLFFERFLNSERISLPDIDIDFSDTRRNEVIDYVKKKYGENCVSQIITFGTLSSRAVLKDVGRVLGLPLSFVEGITKQIPVTQGKVMPLAEAFELIPELKAIKTSKDEKNKLLVEAAMLLEGMSRNVSTHAAGVVIAPDSLDKFVPLYKTPSTDLMTQYSMKDLEEAGLLKMDFLGLRTLSVIEKTLDLIKKYHNIEIDLYNIPEKDEKTFKLFEVGNTVAIFQFESTGMQEWLRKLKPTTISDLVAMNALYRPGPMDNIGDFIKRKNGFQPIDYIHPKLEHVLKETYGIIVYQEQVMQIANEIAGFTLAKADIMRRAMGKKDKKLMAELKVEFVAGAIEISKISNSQAVNIFDLIEKFAAYGFNKSHSVAYSVLAYQTAYLKAHYNSEYMASALSTEIGNTDKIVLLIDDCRKNGINVLPPDVNESNIDFTVTQKGIRFGLAAIKNVGTNAVENIIKTRSEKGKFKSLYNFCYSVEYKTMNKKTIESLILAGGFDSINLNRAQLILSSEQIISSATDSKHHEKIGQDNLFISDDKTKNDQEPTLPKVTPWKEREKLSKEKEVLGFYVSGHPLLKFENELKLFTSVRCGDSISNRTFNAKIGGIFSSIKKKIDKKGKQMAFATLEDISGKADCIIFSDTFKRYSELIVEDTIVIIEGKCEIDSGNIKMFAESIIPIEKATELYSKKIFIKIDYTKHDSATLEEVYNLLIQNKGTAECVFNLSNGNGKSKFYRSNKIYLTVNNSLLEKLNSILGENSVKLSQ